MKGRYNLKLNKLKLIMEVILIFSVTALIGMIIWDYLDMKKSSKYADSMINEIDKIIEENKDNDTDSLIIVSEVNNSNESNDNSQSDDNRRTTVIQTQSKTVSISGVKVYGKGVHGRHNDDTGAIVGWFKSQFDKVLREDFDRRGN